MFVEAENVREQGKVQLSIEIGNWVRQFPIVIIKSAFLSKLWEHRVKVLKVASRTWEF